MKCITCNNEIPDSSTICPVCGRSVVPMVNNVNEVKSDTAVIPVTPSEPVLPVDQNLDMTAQMNQVNMMNPSANQVNMMNQGSDQVNMMNQNVNQVNTTPTSNAGLSQQYQSTQMPSQPVLENVNQQANTLESPVPSVSAQNVETPNTPQLTPDFIAPSGESVKLDNTVPRAPEKKKVNKKLLIILIVVGVIVVAAAVLVYLFYTTQYKSSYKRIDAIVDALTMQTKAIKNETIDRSSGSYKADLTVNFGQNSFATKFNGTYAKDLSGKEIALTFGLESLKSDGEEYFDKPLNLEAYLNETRVYVLLKDIYENYIYDEVEGLGDVFETVSKNDINYVAIMNSIKLAAQTGIKRMSNEQKVADVAINGQTKKVNVITIKMNKQNATAFQKGFLQKLANDKTFVAEVAKISEMTEEEVKNDLVEAANKENNYENLSGTIEIYTSMFEEKLEGIKIENQTSSDKKRMIFEVFPVGTAYKISYKVDSQSILDATIDVVKKNTNATREANYKIDFKFYFDEQAYTVNLNLEMIEDVNPKDASVNVKNSINYQYLTEEDAQKILDGITSLGKAGLYIKDMVISFGPQTPEIPVDTPSDDPFATKPNENLGLGENSDF